MSTDKKGTLPNILAINICDDIIRDETTKKISLIGLFNCIRAPKFPIIHKALRVYVCLTNGHKMCKGELRFINDADNTIIFSAEGNIPFKNPLQIVELNFGIANLRFEKPGNYRIEFFCDGHPAGNRRFVVMQMGPTPKESGG